MLHNVVDRALRIPKTYNVPGFDDGIAGPNLIEKMTRHATRYGAELIVATVVKGRSIPHGFELISDEGSMWRSSALIPATGLELNHIALEHEVHETAIKTGVLCYCTVCDGYQHRGKRIREIVPRLSACRDVFAAAKRHTTGR